MIQDSHRSVSLYNDIKTICRCRLSEETINDRLSVDFKSSGTVNWDPQPGTKFLSVKDMRQTAPDRDRYKKYKFEQKFFQ